MKTITPTDLRKNLFKILDDILESEQPVYVKRKKRNLKIQVEKEESRMDSVRKAQKLKSYTCSEEELIYGTDHWQWDNGDNI